MQRFAKPCTSVQFRFGPPPILFYNLPSWLIAFASRNVTAQRSSNLKLERQYALAHFSIRSLAVHPFVQMGIGSLRPFDAISGQALGFASVEIGFFASGHFAGFLLGCIFSPYLVRRAGHSRAFAVMAGVAVISIIAQ